MKYSKKVLGETKKYIKDCHDPVPSKAGLACALDVLRETIYAWEGKYKDFKEITDRLMAF
jgi:hypothetical protein